jgi:hypothetical protein
LYWCALGFWAVLCAGCFNPVGREASDTGDRDEAGLTEMEEVPNTFVVRFTIGDGPRAVALKGDISDDDPRQIQRFLSNYAQLMVLNENGSIAWFGEAQKPNNTFMLTRFNGFVFDKQYRFFLVQGGKAGVEPPTLLAAGLSGAITIPSHAVTEIEITMHCIDVSPSFKASDKTASEDNGVFQLAPGNGRQAVWEIRGLDGLGEFQVPNNAAISGGNAEVPGKAGLSHFQFDGTTVTADIAGLQGAAYFNLPYKPLADKSWKNFPGEPETPPEWIIRNGLNDKPQDGDTDFQALAGGDTAKNGNGAVRFTVEGASNAQVNPSLWITKPLKTAVEDTDAKVEFTLKSGGEMYYVVVSHPASETYETGYRGPEYSRYTFLGTYTSGSYENVSIDLNVDQDGNADGDAVWLMLMDTSGEAVVRSKPVEAPSLMNATDAEAYLARAQVGRDSANSVDPPVHLPLVSDVSSGDANSLIKKINYVDLYLSIKGSIPDSSFNDKDYLTSVSAPEVTEISQSSGTNGIFRDCDKLETVDLPNVISIGDRAFDSCDKLKTVNIPKVQTIGNIAFWGCQALTTLYIPEVTKIGNQAFEQCTALTTLYLGETPPTFGTNVFTNTGSGNSPLTIYVPSGSLDEYIKAWGVSNSSNGIQIAGGSDYSALFGTSHKAITITEESPPAAP